MALVPNFGAFAAQKTVSVLMAEKEAKMKKLQSCQGTTKNLKIAGLSTLGVTAVGIGANIAEAVVLNDYDNKVKKEQSEYDKQLALKKKLEDQAADKERERQQQQNQQSELERYCASLGAVVTPWGKDCLKVISNEVQYADVANVIKAFNANCTVINFQHIGEGLEQKLGKYPLVLANCGSNIDVNFQFRNLKCPENQEFDFALGVNKCVNKADVKKKEDNKNPVNPTPSNTVENHNINRIVALEEVEFEIQDYLEKPEAKCSAPNSKASYVSGYTWSVVCDNITHNFTFKGIKCPAGKEFTNGTCTEPQKTCREGYEYSIAAGDCVEKNSDARDELAKQYDLQTGHSCPEGTRWDDAAYNCVSIVKPKPKPQPKPKQTINCRPGEKYSSITGQCVPDNAFAGQGDCPDGGVWSDEHGGCVSMMPTSNDAPAQNTAPAQPAAPVQQSVQQSFWPTNIQTKQDVFGGGFGG